MKKWQMTLGGATMIVALLLCLWVVLHQRQTIRGYARLAASEARSAVNREKINAVLSQLEIDHFVIEQPGKEPIVVLRQPGQSDAEFVAEVDAARSGLAAPLSLNCVTLQCGTETVEICVACGVHETPEHCQQRLDDLHATYCALHPECTPCP